MRMRGVRGEANVVKKAKLIWHRDGEIGEDEDRATSVGVQRSRTMGSTWDSACQTQAEAKNSQAAQRAGGRAARAGAEPDES